MNYMRKQNGSAKENDPLDLEFPNWDGMDELSTRLTPDQAFQLCEEYRRSFPELALKAFDRQPKCVVEFVL